MNAIFFGLKRAFHGAVRLTRKALAVVGLTAARFDLLYALERRRWAGHPSVLQSELRRVLGVSAPVVSRMLRSLEALGILTRQATLFDRRQRWVRLTAEGRRRVRAALQRYVLSGQVQLTVDSALAGENWIDPMACLRAMEEMESRLALLRDAYRDFASLNYPWHPDD